MAYKYEVNIDGGKYLVESEKELSDQDAYNIAQQQVQSQVVDNAVQPQFKPVPYSPAAETLRSVGQGLTFNYGDELEAALRSGKISGAQYEAERDKLRQQQQSFKQEYPKTAIGAELAGGLALPAGILAKGVAKAPSMYKTITTGAGLGAAQGYGANVNPEDIQSDVLTGSAFGAGGSAVGSALGRVINPELQRGARELMQENIPLTPGAAIGGGLQSVEQMAESIPAIGNLVKGARQTGFESLNKAVLNRALKPLGSNLTVPNDLDNRQGLKFVGDIISSEYNRIYPNVNLSMNKTLERQLNALENRYSQGKLPDDQLNQFKSKLNNLKSQLAKGTISGGRVKAIREDLASDVVRYKQATGSEGTLGDAFEDLNNSLGMSLQNQNKGFRQDIRKTDEAFANFVRAQTATSRSSGQAGVYSPAQLAQAVRGSDISKRKGKTAKGESLMADLANRATDVMGNKVPDSGTAGRTALMAILTGAAGAADPTYTIPSLLSSGLYTDTGMKLTNAYLRANRPESLKAISDALKQGSPYANYGLLANE